jgi:hypothetical protein
MINNQERQHGKAVGSVIKNNCIMLVTNIMQLSHYFFLCLFFLKRFLRLWVDILCLFFFFPLGIIVSF